MSTGTEDINNLSQKNDNLKKKTEPTDNPMAILGQAITHQMLEKISEPKNTSKVNAVLDIDMIIIICINIHRIFALGQA